MIDLLMSRARLNASYACIRARNGLDLPKAAIGTLKVVPKISGSVRDLVDAEDQIGGRGETLRPVGFLHGVHHHQGRGTRSRGSWLLREGLLGVCGRALGCVCCQVECERHSCRCWTGVERLSKSVASNQWLLGMQQIKVFSYANRMADGYALPTDRSVFVVAIHSPMSLESG